MQSIKVSLIFKNCWSIIKRRPTKYRSCLDISHLRWYVYNVTPAISHTVTMEIYFQSSNT